MGGSANRSLSNLHSDMAKLNGLKALFTTKQVSKFLEQKEAEYEDKAIEILQYQGEQFVNAARSINTYTDRTGNLRSSIGYLILKDGEIISRNFQASKKGSEKQKGLSQGIAFANSIAAAYPRGFVLIGVAGMHYAAYVEARKYDVITGSVPSDSDFKKLLNAIKF